MLNPATPATHSVLTFCKRSATAMALATTMMSFAHAEGPMATDDAGTLDKGGMKVETVFAKDDQAKGVEALFGFSVIENLEMEIGVAYDKDDASDPATKARGFGFGAKWVPFQNDTGWSLGARFDYGHGRVDDGEADEQFTEREYAFTGLASWRHASGHVIHINLGVIESKAQGERDSAGIWGLGYELPLAEHMQLTAEIYGAEQTRPDKALGLRYEIFDGFKVSGAVGRGNDRNFGQIGAAWEF